MLRRPNPFQRTLKPPLQQRLHLKKLPVDWSLKPTVKEEDPIQDDDKDDDNASAAIAPKIRDFSKPLIRCHACVDVNRLVHAWKTTEKGHDPFF